MTALPQLLKPLFKTFWTHHEENNRYLWGSRLAALFVRGYIDGNGIDAETSVADLVRTHLKGNWRKSINLKHYKGPHIEGAQERPPLCVKHFLDDLDKNKNILYASVVAFEVRALELLLNGVFEHIARYMLNSDSVDKLAKASLNNTLQRIEGNERYTVSLHELSGLLPTIRSLLLGSTYKREETPFLSTKVNGISCMDAVQLWKMVRNLIIHYDCRVTAEFSQRWSPTFLSVTTDKPTYGRSIPENDQLEISLRQAIFCMTTCHQTAVVLYVASGASLAK